MIEMQEVETKALSFPDKARALAITDAASFVVAGEFLKSIKALRHEIEETFGPITKKAHEAWKESLRQREKVEAPLAEAEGILKPQIAHFLEEQERLRREEELRLQKQAQEDAERRQLENAAILDDLGETEEANRLLEETPEVGIVVVGRTTPKVSGISMATRYKPEVISLLELVKAVATGRAPIQCLKADMVFLQQQATSMKTALHYPGVKVIPTNNISAGRK